MEIPPIPPPGDTIVPGPILIRDRADNEFNRCRRINIAQHVHDRPAKGFMQIALSDEIGNKTVPEIALNEIIESSRNIFFQ